MQTYLYIVAITTFCIAGLSSTDGRRRLHRLSDQSTRGGQHSARTEQMSAGFQPKIDGRNSGAAFQATATRQGEFRRKASSTVS